MKPAIENDMPGWRAVIAAHGKEERDKRTVERAAAGLRNPGGGEHLASHGVVRRLDRIAKARLAHDAIADACLRAYDKLGSGVLPPAVREAVEAYRKAEGTP